MAIEKYLYGIKTVKYGTPTGTNTMPVTLTQWAQTVEGSFELAEEKPTKKLFKTEEASAPVKSLVTDSGVTNLKWEAFDLTPALVAIMTGGTAGTGSGTKTYAAPVVKDAVELAIQVETTNGAIFNFYNVSLTGSFTGNLTRGDLLKLAVEGEVLDPGNGASAWGYSTPDPV